MCDTIFNLLATLKHGKILNKINKKNIETSNRNFGFIVFKKKKTSNCTVEGEDTKIPLI